MGDSVLPKLSGHQNHPEDPYSQNPFRRFVGYCNQPNYDVNECLREEREANRKLNADKSKAKRGNQATQKRRNRRHLNFQHIDKAEMDVPIHKSIKLSETYPSVVDRYFTRQYSTNNQNDSDMCCCFIQTKYVL